MTPDKVWIFYPNDGGEPVLWMERCPFPHEGEAERVEYVRARLTATPQPGDDAPLWGGVAATSSEQPAATFAVGDLVSKTGGDYTFRGEVRGVLVKRSGAIRYVCENDDGLLFIFKAEQLVSYNEG